MRAPGVANFVDIAVRVVRGRIVILAAEDNLVRGASGVAIVAANPNNPINTNIRRAPSRCSSRVSRLDRLATEAPRARAAARRSRRCCSSTERFG